MSVDLKTRTVETAEGQQYQGDFLVLAAGSQANFFGTPGAAQHAYPLYSIHDAELLRSRILAVLESADRDSSLVAKGALNFVIVGAGPTGTEMAGAFGDMARVGMKKVYEDFASGSKPKFSWWIEATQCWEHFPRRPRPTPPKCLSNAECNCAWAPA